MSLEKKLLEEVKRYNNINHYIKEQDELPPLPGEGEETTDELPAAPEGGEDTAVEEVPEPVDIDTDPEVEVVGDEIAQAGHGRLHQLLQVRLHLDGVRRAAGDG